MIQSYELIMPSGQQNGAILDCYFFHKKLVLTFVRPVIAVVDHVDFSVIISEQDVHIYRRLGIHLTMEPKYESQRLYHK